VISLALFCSSVSTTFSSTCVSSAAAGLPFGGAFPPFFLAASSSSFFLLSSSSAFFLASSSSFNFFSLSSSSFFFFSSSSAFFSLSVNFFFGLSDLGSFLTTGSGGCSSFSSFFSRSAYSFLKLFISLLKKSSRFANFSFICA